MTKTYEKGVGGADATKVVTNTSEAPADMNLTAPRVKRGTVPPATGPGRDRSNDKQKGPKNV
jgi:hypothetical protein